jgi:hypothetical protein
VNTEGIIVVGMHRSGTSAMTGALRRLGLTAGDESALIGASPHNPSGHHEILELVIQNELFLRQLGGTWFAPPPFSRESLVDLAGTELRAPAAQQFRKHLTDVPWVWKDPRLSLLLPFWRSVLDDGMGAIIMVRAPQHVARSLRERSAIDAELAFALWEHYNRAAVAGATGMPAYIVDYDDLVGDPPRILARVGSFLDDVGASPTAPDLDAAADVVTGHQRAGRRSMSEPVTVPSNVDKLYQALHAARGEMTDGLDKALPDPSAGLDRLFEEARQRGYEAMRTRRGTEQPSS